MTACLLRSNLDFSRFLQEPKPDGLGYTFDQAFGKCIGTLMVGFSKDMGHKSCRAKLACVHVKEMKAFCPKTKCVIPFQYCCSLQCHLHSVDRNAIPHISHMQLEVDASRKLVFL